MASVAQRIRTTVQRVAAARPWLLDAACLSPDSAILQQGTLGCSLLVGPDLLDLYVPTAGTVATSFAIPNALELVNQVLHQQVVALDLTPLGAITALTITNAITLTVGHY